MEILSISKDFCEYYFLTTWHGHPVICVFSQPRVERQEVNHTILVTKSPDAGSYQIFTLNQHFRIVTKHREPSTQPQHYSTWSEGNNIHLFLQFMLWNIYSMSASQRQLCICKISDSKSIFPQGLTKLSHDIIIGSWCEHLDCLFWPI